MSIITGAASGTVTIIEPRRRRIIVIKRSDVAVIYRDHGHVEANHRGHANEIYITLTSGLKLDVKVTADNISTTMDVYNSIIEEDVDVVWNHNYKIWHRTPDKESLR